MTLKEQIKLALNIPESSFYNHNSDLLILCSEAVIKWLKVNYEFFKNITLHLSNIKGQSWYGKNFIEIPFAYEEYFNRKFIK